MTDLYKISVDKIKQIKTGNIRRNGFLLFYQQFARDSFIPSSIPGENNFFVKDEMKNTGAIVKKIHCCVIIIKI